MKQETTHSLINAVARLIAGHGYGYTATKLEKTLAGIPDVPVAKLFTVENKTDACASSSTTRPRPGDGTECQKGYQCSFPECSCPRTAARASDAENTRADELLLGEAIDAGGKITGITVRASVGATGEELPIVKTLRDRAALLTKDSFDPFAARKDTVEWTAAAIIERMTAELAALRSAREKPSA